MVESAKDIILERFIKNNIPLSHIEGKKVLDMGSGSGRYSCALSLLGAGHVVAIDWGEIGLAQGRHLSDVYKLSNIEFKKHSFLNLPFADNTFDFVFCNGTVHHSEDMVKSISELHRVLKAGKNSWIYVYGSGGVFWSILREFNDLIKRIYISKEYAMKVLEIIGMPRERYIFIDHWYVPIFIHSSKDYFEEILFKTGFTSFRRCDMGRETDLDNLVIHGTDNDRRMWGDGDLRYLVKK